MKRPSKYRAIPTMVDGVRFASKKEARRDAELRLLERVGKIEKLMRQRPFKLRVHGVEVCKYIADWSYIEDGKWIVEDAKGVQTPVFKLKWKLCQILFPSATWRLS